MLAERGPIADRARAHGEAGRLLAAIGLDEEARRMLKRGIVPFMQIGAFELPKVEAVHLDDAPKDLEIEIDGTIGAPLFAAFRVTLFDGGRALWLEDHPAPLESQAAPESGMDGEAGELLDPSKVPVSRPGDDAPTEGPGAPPPAGKPAGKPPAGKPPAGKPPAP